MEGELSYVQYFVLCLNRNRSKVNEFIRSRELLEVSCPRASDPLISSSQLNVSSVDMYRPPLSPPVCKLLFHTSPVYYREKRTHYIIWHQLPIPLRPSPPHPRCRRHRPTPPSTLAPSRPRRLAAPGAGLARPALCRSLSPPPNPARSLARSPRPCLGSNDPPLTIPPQLSPNPARLRAPMAVG